MPRTQGKNSESSNGKNERGKDSDPAHYIEWVIGAISGVLIAALLAYFAYQALSSDNRPPVLLPTIERIEEMGGNYHVLVSLRNEGDKTAAGAILRATLSAPGGDTFTSEISFDYVPAGSVRHGAFVFPSDPAAGDLAIQPIGYNDP